MLREATTSDAPDIRALMQAVRGFWQPWWSQDTIAEAIRSSKWAGLRVGTRSTTNRRLRVRP
jgi:hypothetical protein